LGHRGREAILALGCVYLVPAFPLAQKLPFT
jgi:hypothetical protein